MKDSNDTPKLNMHKYINCNIIEICINRLSTTVQIFIVMDYSMIMSEKCFHPKKYKSILAKTFFSHPIEVTESMNFGNIIRIVCFYDYSKTGPKTWKKLE